MDPEQAPPGIECHFVDIWRERSFIRPRGLLIHTNGASVESTLAAQLRWSNAAHDNTKPHYVVDRKGAAWKTLPSNRKGIANYLADAFFLSIETTDLGWPSAANPTAPGGKIGFSLAQAEMVARIVAWESELWQFPIETPARWDGSGVAAHTDPFTFPFWTKYAGKACPGPQKKLEVRSIILPRANAIRFPPKPKPEPIPVPKPEPVPPEDDDMQIILYTCVDADAAFLAQATKAGIAMQVEWTGPGDDERAMAGLQAQLAAGAIRRQISVADLGGVSLIPPLPTGDSRHNWDGSEFRRVLG